MKRNFLLLFLLFLGITSNSFASVNLTISGGTVPNSMYRSQSYPIAINVKNTGTTSTTTGFYLNVSINTTNSYDGNQTYLGQLYVSGGISAGSTITWNTTITIPCTYTTGTRYILAGADATNTISESSETDNNLSFSILLQTAVDLVPLNYSLSPSSVNAGNSITSNFAVNNNGGSPAGGFNVGFYLSTTSNLIVGQAILLGGYSISSIPACGQTIALNKTLLIPSSTCTGNYYLFMWIDDGLVVNESDDNNNFQSQPIYVNGVNAPSPPTAYSANSITTTSFNANWSSVSGVSGYYVDISTSSSFSSLVYSNYNVGNTTSYNFSGLNCNTNYYYRVRSSNNCGTSGNSSAISVLTNSCCTTPPIPTLYTPSVISSSQIDLSWSNVSASNYTIYYSTVGCYSGSYITYSSSSTSTSITGLNPSTTYYFWLQANNSICFSGNSNCISTTTLSSCTAPSITQLADQWTIAPGSANFSINATGGATPYSYLWQYNTGSGWNYVPNSIPYSGVSSSALNISNTNINMSGYQYRCIVSSGSPCNSYSAFSNSAVLNVTAVINQYTVYNKLPYAIFPFSNPYPLASGNTSSLATAIKICADGSQATQLSYVNNDATVTTNNIRFWIASDPYGNDVDQRGYFINYQVIGNTVKATFAHPKYLNSSYLLNRLDSIFVIDITNSVIPKFKIPIQIYHAPVLFVHGFNGNGTTFASMANLFTNNNYYPSSLLNLVDYNHTSLLAFSANIDEIPIGVYGSFYKSLVGGFSSGKVDVVAHSMGGILSRLYLQDNYGFIYKGEIHKLITLNTPHSGSHFANWAMSQPTIITGCLVSLLLYQNSILCNGAGADLETNSYVIDNVLNSPASLLKGHVPSHTISSYINDWDIGNCVNPIELSVLSVNSLNVPFIFGFGQQMDGVVRVDSQKGGLVGQQSSSTIYQCHLGAADNLNIQNDVLQLLCANPSSGQFSINGFNPPNLLIEHSSDNRSSHISHFKQPTTSSFVNIISPSNNAFISGQTITISINADTSIKRLVILVGNSSLGVTYFDTTISSSTSNLSYTIPSNAIGKVEIDAIGLDLTNILASDSVTFNVNNNSTLNSIEISPSVILVPTNLKKNFRVIGHYSNGITSDVTLIPGIQFNVSNSGIAHMINPGSIEGIINDSTELTVSYLGISKTIPVYVYNGDNLTHALFSANTNAICDSGQVAFLNYTTGHPLNFQWLFPGGSPAISSIENPIVFYNSLGHYDVSLIATYLNKIDTLYLPEFVTVESKLISTLSFSNDTIHSSVTNGYLYQWYHNNNPINGNYQFSIPVNFSGYYYVDIMNNAGCIARSDTFYYTPTNVIYFANNFNISIYPNPTTGKFTLSMEGLSTEQENVKLNIYNMFGEKVFQNSIQLQKNLIIDLSDLSKGIYFLQIQSKKKTFNQKLILSD